jgi:hypothetical protein
VLLGLRGLIRHHVAVIYRIVEMSCLTPFGMAVAVMYRAYIVLSSAMELPKDYA